MLAPPPSPPTWAGADRANLAAVRGRARAGDVDEAAAMAVLAQVAADLPAGTHPDLAWSESLGPCVRST
jgi:hypothetical protein